MRSKIISLIPSVSESNLVPLMSPTEGLFHFPQGSNIYKSISGTKVIKVNLTGDGWLDPSTVQLQFTLKNGEAKNSVYWVDHILFSEECESFATEL